LFKPFPGLPGPGRGLPGEFPPQLADLLELALGQVEELPQVFELKRHRVLVFRGEGLDD
jgi:hypothetical protein